MYNAGQNITVNYDIENIKKFPDVLQDTEDVVITEKIHGTFCQVIFLPESFGTQHPDHFRIETEHGVGYIAVSSKGMGAQGLCFKHNERNAGNAYLRATKPHWNNIVTRFLQEKIVAPVAICGEVFGDGVQDLKYGLTGGKIDFRVFDMYVGTRGSGEYLDYDTMAGIANDIGLETVPLLYCGKFNKQLLESYAQHTKSVFDEKQIREGVVIKPTVERYDQQLGRAILKSINEDYLLRKGNVTEFN
jgi:RNA ligase (TIGR02306 family)